MGYLRVPLEINEDHLGWLTEHGRRLGYFGRIDYLNAIVETALNTEKRHNEELMQVREAREDEVEIEDEVQMELPFPAPDPAPAGQDGDGDDFPF